MYQEQFGALGAEIDRTITDLNEKINAAATANGIITGERDYWKSEFERVSAELDACQNPPQPATTVFGVSAPQNTTGGGTLKTPGERIFLSPGQRPTTVSGHALLRNAIARLVDGGTLWLSIKDRAGAWFEALITDIYKVQPDIRLVLTANHEPKDNFDYRDPTSWAQWISLQESFEAVVAKFPEAEAVTIVEAWNNPTRAPGYWDACLRPNQKFGADSYNRGIGAPGSYVPPVELHKPLLDYVNAKKPGQALYIGETGSGIVDTTPEGYAGRTEWLEANRAYMAEHADVAMWWNSGTDGPTGQGCKISLSELELWLGL